MRFSSILIASTLISCNISTEEELKSLYEKMPTDETNLDDFAKRVDSTLKNVPLWVPAVSNKFAPFLLHSGKHKNMLKGMDMDLRLVYETKSENLKNHWIEHPNKDLGSLRFSFNIAEINKDNLLNEIEFCNKFSNLTKVELLYESVDVFDESVIWNNSMLVLSKLKEISKCTELELNTNDLNVLKYIIDGATSKSEALQQLKKLKIVFNSLDGIYYLDSALENFSSLVTSLLNLSEITIENEAEKYKPGENPMSDNLDNLIKKLPENIKINLIGRFIELNQGPELVKALKEKSNTGNVFIVYKLDSFSKEDALSLRAKFGVSKMNIKISGTSNRIKRHLPITTEILDNLLKVEGFKICVVRGGEIYVKYKNVNDFLSSFGHFLKGWEWEKVIYTDKNLRTKICELSVFLKGLKALEAFNKCKSIRFKTNVLELNNENDMVDFISEVKKGDERLVLDPSALLVDSENFDFFYTKVQDISNRFDINKTWLFWRLIRVRKGKVDAFKDNFSSIYKKVCPKRVCPKRNKEDEFLERIKALSELDAFIINLRNKDVIYIEDRNFDDVLKVLQTIKNMFEKVFVAEDAFTAEQIEKLREKLGNGGSCTLETGTEESLLILDLEDSK
ncbi:hypothetical protein GINT2_001524 [Glugoides intestinalis]